ncbi:MAG: sulfatase, partial [Planctomycetes bacterium]|nr:sulfatase [Planctomycetota bacterium]
GWRDLSYAGSSFYETPHIDSLAREGVVFTRANMSAPRCVSSRLSLMTGQYPYRNKLKNKHGISRKTQLLSESYQKAGYRTFFAGKWHLGHEASEFPDKRGFDVNVGGCAAGSPKSYFFPYHKGKEAMPGLESKDPDNDYLTDRLTSETEAFIRKHAASKSEKPFFAFLSHYGVHTPIQGKAELVAKYEKKLDNMAGTMTESESFQDHTGQVKRYQNNPVYAAMVESIDESVGRLRIVLRELGIDKNTLIVFTSDHGGLSTTKAGGKRELATSNLPLRTGKGWLYEGGLRVPFIVFDPREKGGISSQSVINGTDIYPTLLDLSGIPSLPQYHKDGFSFADVIRGKEYSRPQPVIYHYMFAKVGTGNTAMSVVLDDPYKLVYLEVEKEYQLYHLVDDPGEKENLAAAKPEIVSKLEKVRVDWLKELEISPLAKSHSFYTTSIELLKKAKILEEKGR